MGLLIEKTADLDTEMAGTWSLRQPFAASCKENTQDADVRRTDDEIDIGDFKIDTNRHRAFLQGQPLDLTLEEFDLLVFLIANRQRFVTPHTMLATKWTEGRPYQIEFLRVLLSLQRKLETAAAGQHYIRTEPWVVYRFDPAASTTR